MTKEGDQAFRFRPRQLWRYFQDRKHIVNFVKVLIPYLAIYLVFLLVVEWLQITPAAVQEVFMGKGALLVPLFVLMELIASLTPLPDLPFIAAGILFFPPWQAFLLIWAGMWLGSSINFMLARRLGQSYVHKHYPATSSWVDKFAGKYGLETVVIGRNFTFVTFDLVAYAAGVSEMSFGLFSLASVVGLAPVALNATLLGWALLKSTSSPLVGVALFSVSTGLALALGFAARKYRLWREAREG